MAKLVSLHARELLDSRGNPTVEVVASSSRFSTSAITPSGASTGSHEAIELRDGGKRFQGKGVLRALEHVNTLLAKKIIGCDVKKQRDLDNLLLELDGTQNKSKLGANAILPVSLACAKLAALEAKLPFFMWLAELAGQKSPRLLPLPMMNIINGGVHANSGLEFQEMMILPVGAPTLKESVRMGAEIFHALKKLLADYHFPTTVGDEGGFAPHLSSHEKALDLILEAIKKAGYRAGKDVKLGLDCAATEFFAPPRQGTINGKYSLHIGGKKKTAVDEELVSYYEQLVKKYPIVSIEDGYAEDDFEGWELLTKKLGKKIQLVGDDLFVTNPLRLAMGVEHGIANAILIKLNQIGTLTETIDVILQAKRAGYQTIVSHRSGETEDTTIAHLAVGLETGQIKTGSLSRGERTAKYNELMRIEEMLGKKAQFRVLF